MADWTLVTEASGCGFESEASFGTLSLCLWARHQTINCFSSPRNINVTCESRDGNCD